MVGSTGFLLLGQALQIVVAHGAGRVFGPVRTTIAAVCVGLFLAALVGLLLELRRPA